MKRQWEPEELIEQWAFLPMDQMLLANKTGPTRLGFAVLLLFFHHEGRFPQQRHEVPRPVVRHIAAQVGVAYEDYLQYDWSGRSIKYHRAQIRDALGFREATVQDADDLAAWLCEQVVASEPQTEAVAAAAYGRLRSLKVEPPTTERMGRIVRSAIHTYEDQLYARVLERLSPETVMAIDALLAGEDDSDVTTTPNDEQQAMAPVTFLDLKADPGRLGLDSMLREIAKLQRLRQIVLPPDLFAGISPKLIQRYRDRIAAEPTREVRRHAQSVRLTLVAAFCLLRSQEITDSLVDLLSGIVHKIGVTAEQRVDKILLDDFKRVTGKTGLLYRVAAASLEHPDERVRDVIYPVASEQTLRDLVREYKATGRAYKTQVHTVMRRSYGGHYRRMVPWLLQVLRFRSNNEVHRPVIRALDLIKAYADSHARDYAPGEDVPMEGVVPRGLQDLVLGHDTHGATHINRITYEIYTLEALREGLRCREIWVEGANRFRNPDEDLPADFDAARASYYETLRQPRDADVFIAALQEAMQTGLERLHAGLPKNKGVRILEKSGGWIAVSPLESLPEPANLARLKAEVARLWPMTNLLDFLKETDLQVHFTDVFQSTATREMLDPATLQRRLLLCLYGLGTNTGLKRIAAGEHEEKYHDLLYVRRRYLQKEQLREAIRRIVNALFQSRLTAVWGEGTTACASDSKKFGAWDQNLMTEYHARLRGRGQSEIGFAFSHLLGFQLMPRLKAIHAQKLYLPFAGAAERYARLAPVLSRVINWELIRQQYDQMIKYATALRLGTAETESILRRFARGSIQHPTYAALAELGKAVKTIFLCSYLSEESVRREVHVGLEVVENWNSANSFIFYGRGGELASNRSDDREVSALALHLLQIALVYINTRMIQHVLVENRWLAHMMPEDLRALTPLIYNHVNPYGTFRLDMHQRLSLMQTDEEAAG